MDSFLLNILVCPLCKEKLQYDEQQKELLCLTDKLAYPIEDGVPIMLSDTARVIAEVDS